MVGSCWAELGRHADMAAISFGPNVIIGSFALIANVSLCTSQHATADCSPRRVCYCRVARRVMHQQVGWVSGHGAFDPALTAAMVMQQARALQQDIYVLYIDLSSFFPSIHRGVLEAAELWAGVPSDVVDLALLIYGAADDPENAVDCQFDSAAGLSSAFKNPRGALMGCVLSPDKAKLLLNSIVAAISLHIKGVRLFGWGEAERSETWRHISQLMFADDWCGTFHSAAEARAAWQIWRAWEPITGCKLGIKATNKGIVIRRYVFEVRHACKIRKVAVQVVPVDMNFFKRIFPIKGGREDSSEAIIGKKKIRQLCL